MFYNKDWLFSLAMFVILLMSIYSTSKRSNTVLLIDIFMFYNKDIFHFYIE